MIETEKKDTRSYGMASEKVSKLMESYASTGVFPNPFRPKGPYWAFVQSLIDLGLNKVHPYVAVRDRMKELLSPLTTTAGENAWEIFERSRTKKPSQNPKDLRGRIIQNAQVLQRLSGNHPCGEKLRQLHAAIDIIGDGNGLHMFRLNTIFESSTEVVAINELKHRHTGRRAAK